jgi:hypothetical protein
MKTLCELKRKELAKFSEAWLEEKATHGYLCRDCLRFFTDKKRLCDPVALKKVWKVPEPLDLES